MIPTKARDLVVEVAINLGIPKEHLTKMVNSYYKGNRKLASNLAYLHLTLRGLGTLTIKGWEIDNQIRNKEKELVEKRYTYEENIPELERRTDILKKIKVKWDEEREKKKDHLVVKKEYYKQKELDNDFKRKITDSLEE